MKTLLGAQQCAHPLRQRTREADRARHSWGPLRASQRTHAKPQRAQGSEQTQTLLVNVPGVPAGRIVGAPRWARALAWEAAWGGCHWGRAQGPMLASISLAGPYPCRHREGTYVRTHPQVRRRTGARPPRDPTARLLLRRSGMRRRGAKRAGACGVCIRPLQNDKPRRRLRQKWSLMARGRFSGCPPPPS